VSHAPVAAFGSISERAFALYTQASGGDQRGHETPTQHLVVRMMYVAEVTSTAARLNASWALTHAGLSLLRDRYEQVVRFSWLARQPDNSEMVKYIASYYAKGIALYHSLPQSIRDEFEKIPGGFEKWMAEKPRKDQKTYLNRWNTLDLRSMAEKRDKLPPLSNIALEKESLAHWYVSIYAQFSSVTHYDMYSINMLGIHRAPDGAYVLAADPQFPAIVNLHNALFDLIQCYEATYRFFNVVADEKFGSLFDEWNGNVKRVLGPPNDGSADS
jgi:hypothetical protein